MRRTPCLPCFKATFAFVVGGRLAVLFVTCSFPPYPHPFSLTPLCIPFCVWKEFLLFRPFSDVKKFVTASPPPKSFIIPLPPNRAWIYFDAMDSGEEGYKQESYRKFLKERQVLCLQGLGYFQANFCFRGETIYHLHFTPPPPLNPFVSLYTTLWAWKECLPLLQLRCPLARPVQGRTKMFVW